VILGYEEEQQADIDTWPAGMGLAGPANRIPWVEMPVDAGDRRARAGDADPCGASDRVTE